VSAANHHVRRWRCFGSIDGQSGNRAPNIGTRGWNPIDLAGQQNAVIKTGIQISAPHNHWLLGRRGILVFLESALECATAATNLPLAGSTEAPIF
jgi:hypothetical protein